MPKQTSLFLTKEIINTGQSFVFGETGIRKPVAIAGNDDSIIKSIHLFNNSFSGNQVIFYLSGSSMGNNLYPIFNLQVPANAGSGVAPSIDVFSSSGIPSLPIDNAGKRYYPLGSGNQILAQIIYQVSTGTFGAGGAGTTAGFGGIQGVPPTGALSITTIQENY